MGIKKYITKQLVGNKMATTKEEVLGLLYKQLNSFFDISINEKNEIEEVIDCVLDKCAFNFSKSESKYFQNGFNAYHSVMYMIFLYYLSNVIYKRKIVLELCDKIYYLNKIMHSVDLFYAIELPDVFSAEHPLSSVMGRAQYGNGFFFYQSCTVGGTRDKEGNVYYPIIGNNVRMYSNSSILGKCHIGNNVKIGAGAIVKNQDVPDNCTVFGESPNLIIKTHK